VVVVRLIDRRFALIAAVMVVTMTAGCATSPERADTSDASERDAQTNAITDTDAEMPSQTDDGDPLESVNRAVFEFNDTADRFVLRPLAVAYRDVVPDQAQRSVHNALGNLRAPIVLANDMLQGDFHGAGVTFSRFLVNSTFGVLGLFDVANDWGLQGHDQDFGLTFASWKIEAGPYLVLPILGPSNPRDASGLVVEFFTDPFSIVASNNDANYLNYTRYGLTALDQRSRVIDELDNIRNTSLDYYAAIRSLYQQRRAQQIQTNRSRSDRPAASTGTPEPGAVGTPSGIPPPETGATVPTQ
jgi:phospholipid-binding lipoprotein MlaA